MPFNKKEFEKNKEELEEKIKKKTAGNTEDIVGAYKTIIYNASGGNNKDFWGNLVAYRTDETKLTILERAIVTGNIHLLQAILAECPPNRLQELLFAKNTTKKAGTDDDIPNETALHLAIKLGNIEIINALLEKCPADQLQNFLLEKNADGNNAMHLAALHDKTKIAEALLNKCNTNEQKQQLLEAQNKAGDSPLHLEARNGKSSLIPILLSCYQEQGPETKNKIANTANAKNETVLQLLIQNTDPDIIKVNIATAKFAMTANEREKRIGSVLNAATQNAAIETLRQAADISIGSTYPDDEAREQTRQFIVAIQASKVVSADTYSAIVNATILWKNPAEPSAQNACLKSAENLGHTKGLQKAAACLGNLTAALVVKVVAVLVAFVAVAAMMADKKDVLLKAAKTHVELNSYSTHLFNKGLKQGGQAFFKTGKKEQEAGAALDNLAKKPPTRPKQ